MDTVTLMGLDLGEHFLHLHGQYMKGLTVLHKKLRRKPLIDFFVKFPPCTAAIQACAGAHDIARELVAMGHDLRSGQAHATAGGPLSRPADREAHLSVCATAVAMTR